MKHRATALHRILDGQPLTARVFASIIGGSESNASAILRSLYIDGHVTRRRVASGVVGQPAWEYVAPHKGRR